MHGQYVPGVVVSVVCLLTVCMLYIARVWSEHKS